MRGFHELARTNARLPRRAGLGRAALRCRRAGGRTAARALSSAGSRRQEAVWAPLSADEAKSEQNLLFASLQPNARSSTAGSRFPSSFGNRWLTLSLLRTLHAKSFVTPVRSAELLIRRKLTWLHIPPWGSWNSAPQQQQPAGAPRCRLSADSSWHRQTPARMETPGLTQTKKPAARKPVSVACEVPQPLGIKRSFKPVWFTVVLHVSPSPDRTWPIPS